ncbi:hypothetical protein FQA39_LY02421 [Lamprigera yunnana]|nr:hypothetical protein FQA39_LY02421 [Lamprigera yunnana]
MNNYQNVELLDMLLVLERQAVMHKKLVKFINQEDKIEQLEKEKKNTIIVKGIQDEEEENKKDIKVKLHAIIQKMGVEIDYKEDKALNESVTELGSILGTFSSDVYEGSFARASFLWAHAESRCTRMMLGSDKENVKINRLLMTLAELKSDFECKVKDFRRASLRAVSSSSKTAVSDDDFASEKVLLDSEEVIHSELNMSVRAQADCVEKWNLKYSAESIASLNEFLFRVDELSGSRGVKPSQLFLLAPEQEWTSKQCKVKNSFDYITFFYI